MARSISHPFQGVPKTLNGLPITGLITSLITVLMISLAGCSIPKNATYDQQPDDQIIVSVVFSAPRPSSEEAISPLDPAVAFPPLADSLAVIDQLTDDLAKLTDQAIMDHASQRDLDVLVIDAAPALNPMPSDQGQMALSDIASFQATTAVQCLGSVCSGVVLNGTSDVAINLHNLQAQVINLFASDASGRYVLSGDLHRDIVYDHLQSLAQADMVLTVDRSVYFMDEAAGLFINKDLAKTGVLEGGFDLRHHETGTTLIGDLTN